MANIEQELMIVPISIKDVASEGSHVQLFIDIIIILYIVKHYSATEETAGANLCNSFAFAEWSC